jgi:hypothetical protein
MGAMPVPDGLTMKQLTPDDLGLMDELLMTFGDAFKEEAAIA